ncbi:MAG: tetratricopeptide repeat protein [Acidimicrobiia bacterium]
MPNESESEDRMALTRAIALVEAGDDEAALDLFDELALLGTDSDVRADAAVEAARICLGRGRTHEAEAWVQPLRNDSKRRELVAVLEAVANLQRGDAVGALERLEGTAGADLPRRTRALADLAQARALVETGDPNGAEAVLVGAIERDPSAPDGWFLLLDIVDDLNRVCTAFDALDDDAELHVLGALTGDNPQRADRFAEALWSRHPGDARVLVAAARFAPLLNDVRAAEWSLRLRTAGMRDRCPLMSRGRDVRLDDWGRIRGLAIAYDVFGDDDALVVLEHVAADVEVAELVAVVHSLLDQYPSAAAAFVAGAATNCARCLVLAGALCTAGHTDEATVLARHGLEHESAATVSAAEIHARVAPDVLAILAGHAQESGDAELAGVLASLING